MKKIVIDTIKVHIKFPTEPESGVLAVAIVSLGPIKIKGFKIQESDYLNKHGDRIWISPPANRGRNGRFHDTVFIEDRDLWNEIEEEIYQEYKRRKEERDNEIPIIEEKSARQNLNNEIPIFEENEGN